MLLSPTVLLSPWTRLAGLPGRDPLRGPGRVAPLLMLAPPPVVPPPEPVAPPPVVPPPAEVLVLDVPEPEVVELVPLPDVLPELPVDELPEVPEDPLEVPEEDPLELPEVEFLDPLLLDEPPDVPVVLRAASPITLLMDVLNWAPLVLPEPTDELPDPTPCEERALLDRAYWREPTLTIASANCSGVRSRPRVSRGSSRD
jgi:hypothetical protein